MRLDNYISLEGIPAEVCLQKQTQYIYMFCTQRANSQAATLEMFAFIKVHHSNNEIFFSKVEEIKPQM